MRACISHPERWPDVQRGLEAAAEELGIRDMDVAAQKIAPPGPDRLLMESVARHLTVGETYFLRDPATLEVVRAEILAPLIRERRARGERRLRLWSAGCCTGEEPYSLAILLSDLLPDLADWKVTLRATDLNRDFPANRRGRHL